MFRCASSRQLQLRCYKRKRAPEYCDEIDELHGCKYWRTLVWCCGSVTGRMCGDHWQCGSVSLGAVTSVSVCCDITPDTHHSQPDTPQRHIAVQWHCNTVTQKMWDKTLDTWHSSLSTRHSAETHPSTVTQKKHIMGQETWHLTLDTLNPTLSRDLTLDPQQRHICIDTTHTMGHDKTHIMGQDMRHLTLDTLIPTLCSDTAIYCNTLDTWYTQPDTPQRHIPI